VFDVEALKFWRVGTALRKHGVFYVTIYSYLIEDRAMVGLLSRVLHDGRVVNRGEYWLWRSDTEYEIGRIEGVTVTKWNVFKAVCRMGDTEEMFTFKTEFENPLTWWKEAMKIFKDYDLEDYI